MVLYKYDPLLLQNIVIVINISIVVVTDCIFSSGCWLTRGPRVKPSALVCQPMSTRKHLRVSRQTNPRKLLLCSILQVVSHLTVWTPQRLSYRRAKGQLAICCNKPSLCTRVCRKYFLPLLSLNVCLPLSWPLASLQVTACCLILSHALRWYT